MRWFVCSLLSVSLLTACSPVATVPMQQYTLSAVAKTRPQPPTAKTLAVTETTAAAGYQTNAMLYVTKLYQLKPFSYNSWVAPPAQMITPLIITSLHNTQRFRAVSSQAQALFTDYRLDTQLLQLQHEFFSKPSRIRVALLAQLIDNQQHTVLATHRFVRQVPVRHADPYSGVLSANQAVRDLLAELTEFVLQCT